MESKINEKFGVIASEDSISRAVMALAENGIKAIIVNSGTEAKNKVLEILPAGAEVMNMTSMTLDAIGVSKEILESGKYDSVRKKLLNMDRKTHGSEMRKIGASPEWAVGSVHAVTEDGKILVASNSGSQLPAYAAAAGNVIWVVGAQKIVKNLDEGIKRLYEYSLPLENERAQKAYGVNSAINKILIFNKEGTPGRITMIIVKEKLGF